MSDGPTSEQVAAETRVAEAIAGLTEAYGHPAFVTEWAVIAVHLDADGSSSEPYISWWSPEGQWRSRTLGLIEYARIRISSAIAGNIDTRED